MEVNNNLVCNEPNSHHSEGSMSTHVDGARASHFEI